VYPVIEKASELGLILTMSEELNVRPAFGMRVKLATRGSGRWQATGGNRSKFGLTIGEVCHQLNRLKSLGKIDQLHLLHFHLGSQISNLAQLRLAVTEATRIYVEMIRRGAKLGILNIGGGLGVDYDGSASDRPSSMNYSMQEYAGEVVQLVQSVCAGSHVPCPEIWSESGRAVAAHHSVLVVDTLEVSGLDEATDRSKNPGIHVDDSGDGITHYSDGDPKLPRPLSDDLVHPSIENLHTTLRDAHAALERSIRYFNAGELSLEQRLLAETSFIERCRNVRDSLRHNNLHITQGFPQDDLANLSRLLSETYFVNFSLFQSIPDAWAIDQLFPIMPIHRLDECPTQQAVLADITCDSDGQLDSFVGPFSNDESSLDCHRSCDTLRLHKLRPGEPYRLAVFLVGAYQEILGDLHNLYGDTHAVHLEWDEEGYQLHSVVRGDTVAEVLGYVQYDDAEVIKSIELGTSQATQNGSLDSHQAEATVEAFREALNSYTYLSTDRTRAAQ
ncbi:MAG: biosynthetic arginine decarboxylase, partial [Planctomycetota bacterium]